MAKKPTIKTFDKCFQEMKRLSGNSLSDEKINEFLDEIKIKINEDKFRNGEEQTKKILEKEIYDNFEYQQALNKKNLAEQNIRVLDRYQKIVDAIELSGGTIDPVKGVEAMLVGIQEFSGLVPKNSIKGICLAEFSKTDKTLSFKEGSPNVMSYSCLATASLKCNTLDAFKRLATFLVP